MSETSSQTPYTPPLSVPSENEKTCQICQATIHKKAEICPKCGVRQRKPASKTTLLLLTFFLGGVGAHRFYLGSYLLGTIYLLLFWTGVPGLIALIEFIVFAFISSEKIEEKYDAHGSVALVAFPIIMISIVGILAAVAIPAYTDYLKRVKVAEAIELLGLLRTSTEEYIATRQEFPPSLDSISASKVSGKYTAKIEVNSEEFYFQAVMKEDDSHIGGKTVRLAFDPENRRWKCSAGEPYGVENRYLPTSCRSTD